MSVPMAPQSLVLAALLVVVAFGQVSLGAEAGESSESESARTILVLGKVPCNNGTSPIDDATAAAAVPPFTDANVNLVCENGTATMGGTATTDAKGVFVARLANDVPKQTSPTMLLLASLLAGRCHAVVTAPLVECDRPVFAAETTEKLSSAPLQVVRARVDVAHTSIGQEFVVITLTRFLLADLV